MGDRLVKIVILIVTLVWGANFAAPLWDSNFKPIPELNAAFMTIVGGLILTGRRSREDEPAENPPTPPSRPPPRTDDGADPP